MRRVWMLLLAAAMITGLIAPASASPGGARRWVEFIGESVPVSVLEAKVYTTDASFKDFGAVAARDTFSVKGAGIEVCVVDTGVNARHEQLDNGKVVAFADFVNGRTTAYDDYGHGTHVASIIAGDGRGTSRLAKRYRGVAPLATISAAKVLAGNGSGSLQDVISGIQWCAERPSVDVINMSLSSMEPYEALDAAANTAVSMGKVVVVSAGNKGPIPGSMGSPAIATNVITVGAASEWSSKVGSPGKVYGYGPYLAPFSSRGPYVAANIKPDVVGPGVTVVAAGVGVFASDNGYTALSGTSMSSPYVAGTVALMLAAKPTLTPPEVKDILATTALDLGKPGKDIDWGWGLVNTYSAVAQALGQPGKDIFPHHETIQGHVEGGQAWFRWLMVNDMTKPLAATVNFDNTNLADPNDQFGWPQYNAAIYAIDSQGTVDVSGCATLEPHYVGWCGWGASGRTEVISGPPRMQGLPPGSTAKGNHILAVFSDSIWSPIDTRPADFWVDIFIVGTTRY